MEENLEKNKRTYGGVAWINLAQDEDK